ncbi:transforming acidic coiled-coil-containing protein 2 isoform X3, partial [Clarias magur]
MGNENSSAALPEGATDNVVLYPPQETASDSTHEAEVPGENVGPEAEKVAGVENGVVQTPIRSLSPVSETDTHTCEDGSGKEEELEFPHDLLPSTDLSTELNITWGASLSSNPDEQRDPLLGTAQHYTEAGPSVVAVITSQDGEAVSKESSSVPQLRSAGPIQENAPSAMLLDLELQEAFQECEKQIASFGMSSHSITPGSTDQIDCCLSEDTSATVNEELKSADIEEDPMSLPISLAESQTGCDLGCHGNPGAQTTDLASCTEEAVFSFRDYILGKTLPEQARAEDAKEHSEKLHSEQKEDLQKEPERETNTDITKCAERNTHLMNNESALTETEDNKIDTMQEVPDNVSSVVHKDSPHEEDKTTTGPLEKPETDTQIITTTGMYNKSTGNDIDYCSVSENFDWDRTQQNIHTQTQAEIITQTKTQSETNPDLKTKADNPIELLDTLGQLGQLCSVPPGCLSHQAHLTPPEATATPTLDHLQGSDQQGNRIEPDGPSASISEHETLNLNSTMEVEHEKCLYKGSTDSTVRNFRDGEAKEHECEKRCSSEACPVKKEEEVEEENVFFIGSEAGTHTRVRGKTRSLSRTSAKGIKTEEESALEEASASAADFTPPLTTSTVPEMIDCAGVRERRTADSETVKMTEKGYSDGTTELQKTQESLCSDGKLSEMMAAEVHLRLLSLPETNNSPAKEAKEVEAASEVRWSRKMLQNSDEDEEMGGGLPVDCSLGRDSLSAAGEKETGTSSVGDMNVVTATPEFTDKHDCKRKDSESLEKRGEGGTEEGRGKERGGAETLFGEQALPLTVTKSFSLHDNGVTLVAPQQRDELVTLVTTDVADTALPLLTGSKTIAGSLIDPSSPVFLLNSTETENKDALEKEAHLKEGFDAFGENQTSSDISLLPAVSADGKALAAQTSYQQVQNTLWIQSETSSTQQNKAWTGKDICHKSEDQHPSSTSQMEMRSSTRSFDNKDGGTGGSQDDKLRQVTGFASLPPLTVHENLWHPVHETSFSFQGLFSNREADPPQNADNTKCESTSEVTEENMTVKEKPEKHTDGKIENDSKDSTSNNITMRSEKSMKNVSTNETETSENNAVTQNPDLISKNKEGNQEKDGLVMMTESTLNQKPTLKDTNEKAGELQVTVLEDGGRDTMKLFGPSDPVVSDVEKKSEVVLTTKEVDRSQAKTVQYDEKETFEDDLHSILSDSVQQESKLKLQTSENVAQKHSIKSEEKSLSCSDANHMLPSHSPDAPGISKKDFKPNTEQPGAIFNGCPLAKIEEHVSELQYQMDSRHDNGPALEDTTTVVSTNHPTFTAIKVSSPVEGSVPSGCANIQMDTKVPIVLRPPGPMMSHWEVINDYNVSLPGEEMQCGCEVKAEISSKIVKTDTLEKPKPVDTTGEKIQNNTGLSCINVLITDELVTDAPLQDTKLVCKEVKGTHLTKGNLDGDKSSKDGKPEVDIKLEALEKLLITCQKEGPSAAECSKTENTLSSQSSNSTDISTQDLTSNLAVLGEYSQLKPEEKTSELQYQTDLGHFNQAVSEVVMSVESTKALTPPEIDVSVMEEGEVLSSNIQSDPKVPPGMMMSHSEVTNEYNVSGSEEEIQCNYNKISTLNNVSVGATDRRNEIMKNDNVEKPDVASDSKKKKNENDNSSLCMNIITDDYSCKQDIKMASKEVDGTHLAQDSDANKNMTNSSQFTISSDSFQQNQNSNTVILEECVKTKREENLSKLQYQTDTDCDSGAVSDVGTSIVSTKDLPSLDMAVCGIREGGVSCSNIQSDLIETPKEHSEPQDEKREKMANDNSSSCIKLIPAVKTAVASPVQDTKLESADVEGANLALGGLHSDENANKEIDFMVQKDPGDEKAEVVLTREAGRQISTHHDSDQIVHTKYIAEVSSIAQGTEQSTQSVPLLSQHCDDSKFYEKCDVISKRNTSAADKVCLSFGYASSESEDRMADSQASPSAYAKSNSLVESKPPMAKENCEIETSTVISQVSSLTPASPESKPVLNQVLLEDTDRFNKDDTVRINKMLQEHIEEENQMIELEQIEEPACVNNTSLFKGQTHTAASSEQSINNIGTSEDGLSGSLTDDINTNKQTVTLDEPQKSDHNLEIEAEKVQTDARQKLIKGNQIRTLEEKKNNEEEKHLDETVPETTCLSDSALIPTEFVEEVQSFGTDLIETTHPSMDQDLMQVTCCEREQTQGQIVFSKLDLAPGLNIKSQSTELKQPQECIKAAEIVETRDLIKYDDILLKELKVSCPSHEVHTNEILESTAESETSCNSLGKFENVTLMTNHDNVVTGRGVCLDGNTNQSEPSIKQTDFEEVSSIGKDMNENSAEDRILANEINQENKFLSISAQPLENTGLNTEVKELPAPVIHASQESKSKPHVGHISDSQISVDTPGLYEAEKLASDFSKPCESSSTSHPEHKTEDQGLSAVTLGKNKCIEVCASVLAEVIQPSVYRSPVENVEGESVADATKDMDNKDSENKAQIHDLELSCTPLQRDTLETDCHNEASMDANHSQNQKIWQDSLESEAQKIELQIQIPTSTGIEEEAKNMETQPAISGEVKQMEHRKEELSGCKEEGRENETAEGRKLTEKSERPDTSAVECDLTDIKEGNERKLPEHKEEDSVSFTVKTTSGRTDLLKSSVSDGLQTEREKELSSSSKVTAIATVSSSQDLSQTLLSANADSGHEAASSFIQTMRENSLDVLKPKDGKVDFILPDKNFQTQNGDGNKYSEQIPADEDRSVTLKSSALLEEDVSDSPCAAVSPVIGLTENTLGTEESCESSDWLRAMKQAASISQSQQKYKLETPCGSADNRPFETFDRPHAEPESLSPSKESQSVKEQPEDPPDSRPLLSDSDGSESALFFPPPPEEDTLPPALHAHLFCDSSEFPTPPPTPPESAPLEPELESEPPVPPSVPDQVPDAAEVLLPQQQQLGPPTRSSDSDGTFETPESTTPVKTAAPPIPSVEQAEPITQPLTSTDTDPCPLPASTLQDCASEVLEPSTFHAPVRSLSIVFDEDKPIASSGTYNIDHILTSEPLSAPAFDTELESCVPLTRSLSFQSGELDNTSLGDRLIGGATNRTTHPRSESFSVGTESAPGTLRRVKKPRPGSLKKKPLSRQNSNPESSTSRTVSSSSTPEIKKKGRPSAESPLNTKEEKDCPPTSPSPSPSPAGTLRRTRIKSRVESPPPVVEENSLAQAPVAAIAQEEILPVPEEDSPIPPSATYKWDPDNFENIDPFCTGGSKLANSPVLGRKGDFIPVEDTNPVPTEEPPVASAPPSTKEINIEEQPITRRQSVRLEFDYSEESADTPKDSPLPPKKLGKKQGAKMPLRKPKLGIKKAPPPTEQLDNTPATVHLNDSDDIPIPKASYNFDPSKWDDHNFNPFSSGKGISNSPPQSRASYTFDPDSFDDSVDPFKASNKMGSSPPKAASLEISSNDIENDNDNVDELEDQNQNKPAKNKKKPLKSNTFRVKKSPKRSPLSEQVAQVSSGDAMPDHLQDHATDEEKLASSTNQKWAARHDMQVELNSDVQDFPQPSDLTAFVNETSLPAQSHDYEIEYMEKIGTSTPPLSVKKPSLYLNLDQGTDTTNQGSSMHHSGPNSPCTGSFEEMEAKISMEGKSPVVSSCGAAEPPTLENSKKREVHSQSRAQSSERDKMEELVLAALRIEALQVAQNISQSPSLSTVSPQERELASPGDSGVSKSSLYSRTGFSEAESPYLPQDLDHSLGIAREEIVAKEKEVLEWQRKYEDSRQELEEMKRIVSEYEKTIAQMIEDEQRDKSLSHHTIQQLILEKDQALADLNSVEKSLADLFRRYEKMKDVLEGFRK